MKILAVTDLYPRPDQPRRGLFNAQLFSAVAEKGVDTSILVLVPEWRLWRWPAIRRWKAPDWRAEGGKLKADEGTALVRSEFVPVFHLPLVGRNLAWWFHVRALRRHRKRFEDADAVLATWLYPDAVSAGIVATECGKPFWVKVHGTDRFHMEHPRRAQKIQEVLQAAAGLLPNSQFLADYLVEHDIPREKVHIVRHGVDHERFRPRLREEAIKALKGVEPQMDADGRRWGRGKVVLYVGNLEKIKGPDRLLIAFAKLRPMSSDLRLLVIGSGSMRVQLEKMACDLGMVDRVHFLGNSPHDEVVLWMNVAGCLCLPSRSEGMPNVVMEALASGCPVVSTDVGDVKRLLKDGVNGYVVDGEESGVVEGLAQAMGSVLSGSWDRHAIAKGMDGYTWEQAAKSVVAYLREAR